GGGTGVLSADAELFTQATTDFNAKKYATARGEFETLLAQYPNTTYADKANVYIAVIDFELKDPTKAKGELMAFFKDFPSSSDADRAQYYLGRCDYSLNDFPTALTEFQTVTTQ